LPSLRAILMAPTFDENLTTSEMMSSRSPLCVSRMTRRPMASLPPSTSMTSVGAMAPASSAATIEKTYITEPGS